VKAVGIVCRRVRYASALAKKCMPPNARKAEKWLLARRASAGQSTAIAIQALEQLQTQ